MLFYHFVFGALAFAVSPIVFLFHDIPRDILGPLIMKALRKIRVAPMKENAVAKRERSHLAKTAKRLRRILHTYPNRLLVWLKKIEESEEATKSIRNE